MKLIFFLLILIPVSITINLKSSDIKLLNTTTTTPEYHNHTTIPVKIKEAIFLYLQFFALFTILSIHRLYEEMFKIIGIYIDNKYSNFINLNELDVSDYDGCYIYVSGVVNIIRPAQDDRFYLPDLANCVKLERIVEILYPHSNIWILPEDDYEIRDNKLVYSYLGDEYTFPNIVYKTFHGEVYIS
jgi:hypothetical protein